MDRLRVVLATVVTVLASEGYQAPNPPSSHLKKLNTDEAADWYEIYSVVLRDWEPHVQTWTILRETRASPFCLKPVPGLASRYRPIIEDYERKNKGTFALVPKFDLPDYTLAWPQGRLNEAKGVASLSAIGFSNDRNRAGVCVDVGHSGGSSGTCLFMLREGGRWRKDTDDHAGCGFGGGVFR